MFCTHRYDDGVLSDGLIGRWMLHPNIRCDGDTFMQVTLFAVMGLLLWSFGIPALLFALISRMGKQRFTPEYVARYGFFYQGFEPNYWYWDLIVK